MKAKIIFLSLLLTFSSFVYSDEVDRAGKKFFRGNPTVKNYIYVLRRTRDNDIRRYAIRKLAENKDDEKAARGVVWALTCGLGDSRNLPQNAEFQDVCRPTRAEAAKNISKFNVLKDYIIGRLKGVLATDPSEIVQISTILSLGIIGGKSDKKIRKKIHDVLEWKIARTSIQRVRINIALAKALGVNNYEKSRGLLIKMNVRGYPPGVKKYIRKALRGAR